MNLRAVFQIHRSVISNSASARGTVIIPRLWRWRWRRSWWVGVRCPCRCLWVRGGWRGAERCGRPVNHHHHQQQPITASRQQSPAAACASFVTVTTFTTNSTAHSLAAERRRTRLPTRRAFSFSTQRSHTLRRSQTANKLTWRKFSIPYELVKNLRVSSNLTVHEHKKSHQ